MSILPTPLRRQLETAIKQARKIAEGGARKALEALAVHEPDPYRYMEEAQRDLRRKLRAQAKQLGDGESQTRRGAYEIKHLVEKLAYDQWHRLLFARFLLENNLLISPEHGVSVSLDDCEELAQSLGLRDAWAVAARFAAKELPEIFRADDPAGAVQLPVENRKPLIQLVTGLPVDVFTASDSLGWCYQFWQAERKDEVNAAGSKIGADELPAVTQLFTEDYMVDFLLDNTLGAWHAGKVLAAKSALAETAQNEEELRNAVVLPGVAWNYLRFIQQDGKWTPAAGTFDGWPKTAKELKCLDPCMGSGHFVVAMFERVVALRTAEEKLDEAAAVAAVICDNLFGLEIDPRCTQIGAFNLALAAWRRLGHSKLPAMNLACSGLAPNAKKEDWLKLAGNNEKLKNGMERLYRLFKDAPVLGSLINPRLSADDMYIAEYHELQPLLEKALTLDSKDNIAHEMTVTARGIAKAAEILAGQFTFIATNVPYLGRNLHGDVLARYADEQMPVAKADLATLFLCRIPEWLERGASLAIVSPQNWHFLNTYRRMREGLLDNLTWNSVVKLGPAAFDNMNWWAANTSLAVLTRSRPDPECVFIGLDVSSPRSTVGKATLLRGMSFDSTTSAIVILRQISQRANPASRIVFRESLSTESTLADFADCYAGLSAGDIGRFVTQFWELPHSDGTWQFMQNSFTSAMPFAGMSNQILWEGGNGQYHASVEEKLGAGGVGAWIRGHAVWGRMGVTIVKMRNLQSSLYLGTLYGANIYVILPKSEQDLAAVFAYTCDPSFSMNCRQIDQKTDIANQAVLDIPFDLAHWQKVATEKYPHGLPKPFSSDPTQWLFNGHPKGSDQPLHVAVARLLGYQWPRQTGSSFPDCPALSPDGLEKLTDKDGIVCLSATKGEPPAAERLRGLLVQAFGRFDLSALIGSAGPKGSKSETLEEWLRDEFFEQHCALFHHRPFIWHIWDGNKSGFSVLVNYHQLTHANLEKLTYAYLGDWIRRQQAAVDAGVAGSDARLEAAKQLQARLKLILEGAPPYDIFVRWKPLSKQAIGWHPDINDGVRMNIRPFALAGIFRKRVKIKWDKDRGNEPVREKKDFPWFWGWDEEKQDFAGIGKEPDGNRWNGCHYTNEFKKKARET
jgi:hypothetical protein